MVHPHYNHISIHTLGNGKLLLQLHPLHIYIQIHNFFIKTSCTRSTSRPSLYTIAKPPPLLLFQFDVRILNPKFWSGDVTHHTMSSEFSESQVLVKIPKSILLETKCLCITRPLFLIDWQLVIMPDRWNGFLAIIDHLLTAAILWKFIPAWWLVCLSPCGLVNLPPLPPCLFLFSQSCLMVAMTLGANIKCSWFIFTAMTFSSSWSYCLLLSNCIPKV